MAQPEEVQWPRIRARLRAKIGSEMFELWLSGLQFEYIHKKTFACSLPTESLVQWARKHYTEDLLSAAQFELKEEELERAVFLHRRLGQPIFPPQEKKKEDEEDPDPVIGTPYRAVSPKAEGGIDSLVVTQAEVTRRTVPTQEPSAATEEPPVKEGPHEDEHFVMKEIAEALCEYFRIPFDTISTSQKRAVVRLRDISIFLVRTLTQEKVEAIGKFFGGRSDVAVYTALGKVKVLQREDTDVASLIAQAEVYVRSRLQPST